MSEEKKNPPQVFFVITRDDVLEVTKAKLGDTVKQHQPCMVTSDMENVKRILRFNDRTSFEVRRQ